MGHIERGGNPVSPRKDDEMKHELEGYLRSGQHTHVDDDIRVGTSGPVPPPGEERDRARARTEAESLRLELARRMDRTAFPADRAAVVRALEEHHAPDPVVEAARDLPKEGTYRNADEIVKALGRPGGG
jgi:hypothetical protein